MDFNAALAQFRKDEPTVSDVHIDSSSNAKPKKRPKVAKYTGDDAVQILRSMPNSPAALAWADEHLDLKWLRKQELEAHDASTAKTPFQYDAHALSDLRPDQVPRFFGALTDPEQLEETEVPLAGLYAMQNRVDPEKVEAIRANGASDSLPVVVRYNGKHYIADGHHRLTAQWLDGKETAKVKIANIGARSNALKLADVRFPIAKTEPDQNRVFGFASVVDKNGKPVVDVQGDWFTEADLEEAFYDFVKNARNAGEMHQGYGAGFGECIECMVFTKAKQEALGIVLKDKEGHQIVPAWVGFEVTPELFAKVRDGTYPAFSIGGSGVRMENA